MELKPVTTTEAYMGYLSGDFAGELPKPKTRAHHFLKKIAEKFGGNSGGEQKQWYEIDATEFQTSDNVYSFTNTSKYAAMCILYAADDGYGGESRGKCKFGIYDDGGKWGQTEVTATADGHQSGGMSFVVDEHGVTWFDCFASDPDSSIVPTKTAPLFNTAVSRINLSITSEFAYELKVYVIDK